MNSRSYRPEIDGLRAIAVLMVIFYHAEISINSEVFLTNGFLGVDIFFVISGFLITRIILNELVITKHFSFIKFYLRRVRRIIPALLLVIITTIPFSWILLLPDALTDYSKSSIASLLFSSNFYFYFTEQEYGAQSSLLKPLLHTWSLAVEEQFYIFFPLILIFFTKNNYFKNFVFVALCILFFSSLFYSEYNSSKNISSNFYLIYSRVWELMFGSIIAYVSLKANYRSNITSKYFSSIGMILLISSVFLLDKTITHPSFYTLIPVLGVGMIILFTNNHSIDIVRSLLSTKIFVGIGLISYSIYLWHYPIFAYARLYFNEPSNLSKFFLIILTIAISTLSYFYVEKPMRDSKVIRNKNFFLIITSGLIIVISFNLITISNNGFASRIPPIFKIMQSDIDHIEHGQSILNKYESLSSITDSSPELNEILVLGDSMADLKFKDLFSEELNKVGYNVKFSTEKLCIYIRNFDLVDGQGLIRSSCSKDYQNERDKIIESYSEPILILFGRWPLYLNKTEFNDKEGNVEWPQYNWDYVYDESTSIEEGIINTIRYNLDKGARIIFIGPYPEFAVDPLIHLYRNIELFQKSEKNESFSRDEINKISKNVLTTSYDVILKRINSTIEMIDIIDHPNFYAVLPHKILCDNFVKSRCIAYNEENIFYKDMTHPSLAGSNIILDLVIDKLNEIQITNK